MKKNNPQNSELLRFTTAGSVDDGKSTLIGRLLYDSKAIFEDQLEGIKRSSERMGSEKLDLSLITDGLKEEREQGITIDVAYRYFATPKRKFIIADTPGHIQYTRNMVTGASLANAALILVDARKGIMEQTLRHSYLTSLLQIQHLIVCVNKMDLVNFSEDIFGGIVDEFHAFASKMDIQDINFIPISALNGDNVVNRSENMPWYQGGTLMHTLENIHIGSDYNHIDARFPVQTVLRANDKEKKDYRGYAGRIAGGVFKPGDEVVILPSGKMSRVNEIQLEGVLYEAAYAPMSVTMTLDDELDISRGCMIAKPNNMPQQLMDIDAVFCWLHEKPLNTNNKYLIQHASNRLRGMFSEIIYKLDIKTLQRKNEDKQINLNDIFRARIKTTIPMMVDSYRRNRITGSFILIDESTNETIAAAMVV